MTFSSISGATSFGSTPGGQFTAASSGLGTDALSQPYNVLTTGYTPPVIPQSAFDRSQAFGDPLGLTQLSNTISHLGDTRTLGLSGPQGTPEFAEGGSLAQGLGGRNTLNASTLSPARSLSASGANPITGGQSEGGVGEVVTSILGILALLVQQVTQPQSA